MGVFLWLKKIIQEMRDFFNPKKLKHLKFFGEDFFLPPREDDLLLRFKEIILVQSSYITFFSFILLGIYEYSINMPLAALISFSLAVFNVIILFYLKFNRKYWVVASMHIFLVWLKVTFLILETGGIDSNMLLWYILVITLAFEYIDDRLGVGLWLLIVGLTLAGVSYLSSKNILFSVEELPLHYEITFNILFLFIFTAILFVYVSEKNLYQKELEAQGAKLDARAHEYELALDELNMQNEQIITLNERLEDKQRLIMHQVEVLRNLMKARTEAIVYINKQKSIIQGYLNELEEGNKYAAVLQHLFLSDYSLLEDYFSRYFVFNRQKYAVGGDFYFVRPIDKDKIFVFLGDATGHASAGAILGSIVTILLGKYIDQNIYMPDEVLNLLQKEIKDLFENTENEKIYYGIRSFALLHDKKSQSLKYASAGGSAFIFKENMIEEIKDRSTIIASFFPPRPVQLFNIELNDGDKIILFTDGYYSQLNPEYKKFSKKRFRELWTRIGTQPIFVQREILQFELEKWKKDMEQTDDITIIALQI